MIVAPGLGVAGLPAFWLEVAQLDDDESAKLGAELERASASLGLHDQHVVAWSIHLLCCCAGEHAAWRDQLHANQTDAEAKDSLEKIAAAAQALGAMLHAMSPRALAYFNDEVLRQRLQIKALDGLWQPERYVELWGVASQAAAKVPTAAGRPATMAGSVALVDGIAQVLDRHRIAVSQGGAFLRICQVVFAAAGVPALPRDAIRRWQRQREKPTAPG